MRLRTRLTILMVAIGIIPMLFVPFIDTRTLSIVFVVAIAVVTVIAYASAEAISEPLRIFIKATQQISEGKLDSSVEGIQSRDEIGQLAVALKSMAAKLKTSSALLEEQAQYSRNAEIAAQNVLQDLQLEKDELARNKAKDDAMLASIGEALVATDVQGRITLVNNVFESMLGWKLLEIKGRQYADVIPMLDVKGEPVPRMERPLQALLDGETDVLVTTDASFVSRDLKVIPVSLTTTPIRMNGKMLGVVSVFRDVSVERALDKAKTEFVSLASHQLRTPLTAISWYTEMILRGDAGEVVPGQLKYLDRIYQGDLRMIALVNTLLDVSRFELGTLAIAQTETNVLVLAREALEDLQPEIKNKELTLLEHFSDGIPNIKTDPRLLQMVLENILSNAVLYTPPKGKIEFSISMDGDTNVAITVSDNGYGIPAHQQSMIFTKMFRADNAREKNSDGSGLGLYLAKSIVEGFGGTIRFQSEENKGTTFYVTLPLEMGKKKG